MGVPKLSDFVSDIVLDFLYQAHELQADDSSLAEFLTGQITLNQLRIKLGLDPLSHPFADECILIEPYGVYHAVGAGAVSKTEEYFTTATDERLRDFWRESAQCRNVCMAGLAKELKKEAS